MDQRIVARWQDWSGAGTEHAEIAILDDSIRVDSVVLAGESPTLFATRYLIAADRSWTVKRAQIEMIGSDRRIELIADGNGNWKDGSEKVLPHLKGAIDVDLSVTPFTNTLPIRRLKLRAGQSEEILAVYIRLPEFTVTVDPQRYTCLEPMRRYRYESLDSDFTREIEVDADGLVVCYPDLFRRLA